MEELFVGLVLAAATGLTFVAYKHPKGYARIFFPIVLLLILGSGVLAGYHGALALVSSRLKGEEVETVLRELSLPWWGSLVLLGVVIYLHFLRALPRILAD